MRAKYPHNTPVWYYPVQGKEEMRRASWTRGEPQIIGHDDSRNEATIGVRLKDGTAFVDVLHIKPREYETEMSADFPLAEPAPVQELMIYFYSASANHPRGVKQWDGTIIRPMIATHADYLEARAEIARDGHVPHHEAVNVHQLGVLGEAQAGIADTAAVATLKALGYTHSPGADRWRPPAGQKPDFDLLDLLNELEAAAEDCPASMSVSDREAGERYSRHLKATIPPNILKVVRTLRGELLKAPKAGEA